MLGVCVYIFSKGVITCKIRLKPEQFSNMSNMLTKTSQKMI